MRSYSPLLMRLANPTNALASKLKGTQVLSGIFDRKTSVVDDLKICSAPRTTRLHRRGGTWLGNPCKLS